MQRNAYTHSHTQPDFFFHQAVVMLQKMTEGKTNSLNCQACERWAVRLSDPAGPHVDRCKSFPAMKAKEKNDM